MMRKCRFNSQPNMSGFTLIEVLITLVISGIMMTAVYSMLLTQQDNYDIQEQVVQTQQNMRAGLDLLIYELRMAGFDPEYAGRSGITLANANALTMTMVADNDGEDNDNDGTVDEEGELRTISYFLEDSYADGDNDLVRQVGPVAATKRAAAENIEAIEFQYLDEQGNVTAVLDNIRSVNISILGHADRRSQDFTDTRTYVTASGAQWGPYNDNFRRRFQQVNVRCRNLGL